MNFFEKIRVKIINLTSEYWNSGRPYKKMIVFPFALFFYIKNGQAVPSPFLHNLTLVNNHSIYLVHSKCAGTTITNELRKNAKCLGLNEKGWRKHKDNSFIFCFVRNPYARILSTYKDKVLNKAENKNYKWDGLIKNINLKGISFEEFVKIICKIPDKCSDIHFQSISYLQDLLKIKPDFIGKVETFEEDWNKINKLLGLRSAKELGRRNQTEEFKKNGEFYNSKLKKLIYERYKEDFIRFGYKKN